jgi:hypothetical protein
VGLGEVVDPRDPRLARGVAEVPDFRSLTSDRLGRVDQERDDETGERGRQNADPVEGRGKRGCDRGKQGEDEGEQVADEFQHVASSC